MWHDARTLNATANGIVAVTVLACAAAAAWRVSQLPMFNLRTIRVESMMDGKDLKNVNHLTLREGAVGRFQGNFFTTDLEKVRTSFESVPWVRRASVRREWPDQLIVTLEEHEALGTWGEDGRLLSVKGDVFTANLAEADEDHVLPEFSGPAGTEKEVMARYADLSGWFKPLGLTMQSLDLSGRYAWTVKFDNGMTVSLGREQDSSTLRDRVQRLVSVYPRLAASVPEIATIDMRYPNGLTLSAANLKLVDWAKARAAAAAAKKLQESSNTTTKNT
ncbi:MAG TPA: cell division protein FtsQ/DivIB [Telluria sp.]|nr:cell division protein FtsQ/DivIB [Telluria sp.]